MTKLDICYRVSMDTGIPEKTVLQAFNGIIKTIKRNVALGETIELRGFGTFAPVNRTARKARHIKTNTEMIVPARTEVRFKPSKKWQEIMSTENIGEKLNKIQNDGPAKNRK